jgi:predicted negative regulator of RcsB-dependent stress response
MDIHHSEEEQIENLKSWWKENGPSVLFGIVVGLGGLFGWHAWQDHKARQATEASALYTELLFKMEAAAAQPAVDEINKLIDTIRTEYDNTVYGSLAALAAAKLAVEQNNTDAAIGHLEWAIKHGRQPEIAITAKLRISRLYLSQGKLEKVGSLLEETYPKAYTAVVEELRGDLLVTKGHPEIARQAYEKALAASEIAPYTRQLIQNKLDQLAPPEPADA